MPNIETANFANFREKERTISLQHLAEAQRRVGWVGLGESDSDGKELISACLDCKQPTEKLLYNHAMISNPLISIITPSYNQAQFLERSILSVLNQDYPAIEYLVVDGGSTDGSADTIRQYAPRLSWWVSEKDQGQADAVNKGLQRAQGKYVGWLNSDDLYVPGAVAAAVRLLETYPQAGFVFGDVQSIDADDHVFNRMRYGDWGLTDLMRFKIIGQPGVFMRTDLLKKVGGLDVSYHYLLDHHLWLRMGLEAGMQYSGQVWAAARVHGAAKNVAQAASFGKEAYRLVEWMEQEPRFEALFPAMRKAVVANADRINARYLLDGGQYRAAFVSYGCGLVKHPPAVLPELHRMLYAFLSMLGLHGLKKVFYRLKYGARPNPNQGSKEPVQHE